MKQITILWAVVFVCQCFLSQSWAEPQITTAKTIDNPFVFFSPKGMYQYDSKTNQTQWISSSDGKGFNHVLYGQGFQSADGTKWVLWARSIRRPEEFPDYRVTLFAVDLTTGERRIVLEASRLIFLGESKRKYLFGVLNGQGFFQGRPHYTAKFLSMDTLELSQPMKPIYILQDLGPVVLIRYRKEASPVVWIYSKAQGKVLGKIALRSAKVFTDKGLDYLQCRRICLSNDLKHLAIWSMDRLLDVYSVRESKRIFTLKTDVRVVAGSGVPYIPSYSHRFIDDKKLAVQCGGLRYATTEELNGKHGTWLSGPALAAKPKEKREPSADGKWFIFNLDNGTIQEYPEKNSPALSVEPRKGDRFHIPGKHSLSERKKMFDSVHALLSKKIPRLTVTQSSFTRYYPFHGGTMNHDGTLAVVKHEGCWYFCNLSHNTIQSLPQASGHGHYVVTMPNPNAK